MSISQLQQNDDQKFIVEKLSDFGTGEPWIARIMLGLPDLVDALMIPEDEKQSIKDLILECALELHHAFESLSKIMEIENDKNVAVLTKENQYQNIYSAIWRAYKDRMPKICKALGYDIDNFLFRKDEKSFLNASKEFLLANPSIDKEFIEMLGNDRKVWQNGLSEFRNNYIEHNKIDKKVTEIFYKQESAEKSFENAWEAIEDIVTILVGSKLEPMLKIYQIPEAQRDPACPKKYIVGLTSKEQEKLNNAK